ncbi:biopolymer transporter ExbD [Ursidibacter maritimus]|uniref:Biopolymer transporter ExbD n=1 Tax=Ursidibacter maritimus TaxID=1331689 RepID=A0A949T335_9PAST|nr:biopolymer transporter ExbD [Ursidibacter maritimus]KAE9540384.1 TonB system transport protein ExbD [Ursidibacter maritimus]MBV6523492.1 biopolymer transporter ExbD [Ursidibacter maritimus]MBV6526731.1 biopolymer transporter ExbD [Ursidibacter maritimus]MBV6528084.1 biopolymer transporter ExbD [Ursidibacter maritimus]MBV6530424.1 biopolymer transporter ExbD [Ursidibacter maritimus]
MAMNLNNSDDVQQEMSEINVTPFIDVMLVLLIIFMATIPLATVNIPINLPASSANEQKNEGTPIILSLNSDNQLYLSNELISFENINEKLEIATHGNKETVIFFRIDKEVKYDLVMQLMSQLRLSGYLKVGLMGINETN